jgi:feruloyl-CoA synthase
MTSHRAARLQFAPAAVDVTPLAGGGRVLCSPQPLGPYARCLGELLVHWAEQTPDRVFVAERDGRDGWRTVTYAQALAQVRSSAQGLLDRGLSAERPVAVLSDNSLDHARLALAAMHVGVPVAPVSPAYSLVSQDYAKLRHIMSQLCPGLVYAADGDRFAKALAAIDLKGAEVVTASTVDTLAAPPTGAVDRAFQAVRPDTVAKILFTSGSTGLPKGVLNTHRMMCSNQQAIAQLWPFLGERPPVIVDWLPWHHTFGGNHNFTMMLRHGGSLYIDDGKPVPGLIERTVANLRGVSPTLYFNVPRGFDTLVPCLETDEDLRRSFFHNLDLLFYAGAALPQHLWTRLEALSIAACGHRVPFVSSWGATETAPAITTVHFDVERAGVVGLPVPGVQLKMLPNGGKLEMRVKGPNVTPGYWKDEEQTRAAFDADGFYMIGDAGRLADDQEPAKGVVFDGRIAEDFKLMSGTWVHVGALRVAAIAACAPIVEDAVVTGHNREEVGLLAFASRAGCAGLCPGEPPGTPLAVLVRRHEVHEALKASLVTLAEASTGNSTRVTRVLLMNEPPSIDANEITDKGYINQRAVLARRAGLVERLYADGDPEVIRL